MSIADAVRDKILTLSAVIAITTTVRPYEMSQGDRTPVVLINVGPEHFENNLDGTCDMVNAKIIVSAISSDVVEAELLAEAIRTNGTVPGTGLAGCNVTGGTVPFNAMLADRDRGWIPDENGKDSGLLSVDSIFDVTYYETT